MTADDELDRYVSGVVDAAAKIMAVELRRSIKGCNNAEEIKKVYSDYMSKILPPEFLAQVEPEIDAFAQTAARMLHHPEFDDMMDEALRCVLG